MAASTAGVPAVPAPSHDIRVSMSKRINCESLSRYNSGSGSGGASRGTKGMMFNSSGFLRSVKSASAFYRVSRAVSRMACFSSSLNRDMAGPPGHQFTPRAAAPGRRRSHEPGIGR